MRRWVLVLLLLFLTTYPALAAGSPISLKESADLLERAARLAEQGRDTELFERVPEELRVQTPQGVVTMELRSLRDGLWRADEEERIAIADQFYILADEARHWDRAGRRGLEQRLAEASADRESLQQMLDGAGFKRSESATDAFWQRVAKWWGEFWENFGHRAGQGMGQPVLIALALAAAGALFYLGRRYLPWERWKGSTARQDPAKTPPLADPGALRAAAQELERAGRRREAIKLLMQAVLSRLERRRLIRTAPIRTNRQHVTDLQGGRPDLGGALGELNQIYEWKVYGEQPATPEEFQQGVALTERLWEEGSSSSAS